MASRRISYDGGARHALRPVMMRLGRRLRQMRDESVELQTNQSSAMAVLLNDGDLLMGELAAEEKVQPAVDHPDRQRSGGARLRGPRAPTRATVGRAWSH